MAWVRRAPRVLVVVGTAALLAGCPSGGAPRTTDVDRERVETVRADPVFGAAVREPTVRLAKVLGEDLGWDRTEVSAILYERPAAGDPPPLPTPAEFETRVEVTLTNLRQQGWAVLWASCEPPSDPGYPSSRWQWLTYAYRVADGVGYWLRL